MRWLVNCCEFRTYVPYKSNANNVCDQCNENASVTLNSIDSFVQDDIESIFLPMSKACFWFFFYFNGGFVWSVCQSVLNGITTTEARWAYIVFVLKQTDCQRSVSNRKLETTSLENGQNQFLTLYADVQFIFYYNYFKLFTARSVCRTS